MHVFLTGGTGTVGSAVVAELLAHDHTVLALARSDAAERALREAGAEVLRGSIADLDVLRAGTEQAGGVVTLAFGRDYSSPDALAASIVEETAAMAVLGEALVGSDRPITTVSGTPWVPGRATTEADPIATDGPVGARGRTQNAMLALASRGVRAIAVRVPRTVHNQGLGGFVGLLTDQARRSGIAGYPGDGTQRWPAVHALDAAVLFRLARESGPAGTVWHAVADEGDAVRDIAAVVGHRPRGCGRWRRAGPSQRSADPPEPARGPGEPLALKACVPDRRRPHVQGPALIHQLFALATAGMEKSGASDRFIILREDDDPDVLWNVEVFRSEQAKADYEGSALADELRDEIIELLAEPPMRIPAHPYAALPADPA